MTTYLIKSWVLLLFLYIIIEKISESSHSSSSTMNNTMSNTTISFFDKDQTYWINLIFVVNQTISRYVMLVVWLIGNIGSILNCFIFRQASLRKSPCALYFIASNIAQFLIFNFILLSRIILFGFNIQTIYFELWYCKFRNYFFYVLLATARYYTILASVDRYFSSCRDTLRRQRSSPKIAIRFIIGNILFWSLIYIHIIFFYENYPNNCLPQKGIYNTIFGIYILIDNGILPLIFMIIFGLLTFKNVQQTKHRVRPIVININTNQINKTLRKDSQFIKMLSNQVILYIILNIFNPCFLFYQTFTINIEKSSLRIEIESLMDNISYFLIFTGFSLTFFLNILSSSLFRNEFKKFIQTKIFHHQSIIQSTTTTIPSKRIPR